MFSETLFSRKQIVFSSSSYHIVGAALYLLQKFPLSAELSEDKSILQGCVLKNSSKEQSITH